MFSPGTQTACREISRKCSHSRNPLPPKDTREAGLASAKRQSQNKPDREHEDRGWARGLIKVIRRSTLCGTDIAAIRSENQPLVARPGRAERNMMKREVGAMAVGHIGLNVSDLEISKAFYQEVLGMRVAKESIEFPLKY